MPAPKVCPSCGRRFHWRKKWARCWQTVVYCSAGCRKNKPGPLDQELEEAILRLLDKRKAGASICPSEAARAVRPDDWRPLMEPTRAAARRLVHRGRLEISQKGQRVDPDRARGAIRLRHPR